MAGTVVMQATSPVMEPVPSPNQFNSDSQVAEPLPNPDFVFPVIPKTTALEPESETKENVPIPTSVQLNPRAGHASKHFQRKSANTLPAFSFNPAGGPPLPKAVATPPASPTLSSPSTPSRSMAHRRGGSEFIGGDGKTGGQAVLSSSPVKDKGGLFPPASPDKPAFPPGPRHRHRRSAALSSHDVSNIMQPASSTSSIHQSSAPTTPSLTELPPQALQRRSSQPAILSKPVEPISPSEDDQIPPPRPNSRGARVGFSDTVEFIPRPLSTISSETESSMSTIRGHSVSGSISSVISSSPASPQSARRPRSSLSTTFEDEKSRSTLIQDLPASDNSSPDAFEPQKGTKRPASISASYFPILSPGLGNRQGHQSQPKKRGMFGLERHRDESDAGSTHFDSDNADSLTLAEPSTPRASTELSAEELRSIAEARRSSPQKKAARKPRKVKSWANSIVPKKSKIRCEKPSGFRRPSTPSHERPVSSTASEPNLPEVAAFADDFNPETAVTIVSEPASQLASKQRFDLVSWQPRTSPTQDSPETFSPVIDLDAALGSFASTSQVSPTRSTAPARRKLHSSRLARDFVGPGMHYHRRAESAPELVPFDMDYSDKGSNSGMADVFEEDEEDDFADSSLGAPSPGLPPDNFSEEELSGIGIQVIDADQPQSGDVMDWGVGDEASLRSNDTSGDTFTGRATPTQHLAPAEGHHRRTSSLLGEVILEEANPVEVVEDHEEPRDSPQPRSSDSTVTSILASGIPKDHESQIPLQLTQPTLRTPASFTESSLSSPGLTPVRSSFETPRLGTAGSSITGSYRSTSVPFGEPPHIRQSIEDVPSLTSSRSTMTSAVQPQHAAGVSSRTLGDASRSSVCSVESAAAVRRRKRSSIASLSRLVGGSFGEKSKLNIEQRPQTEGDDAITSQEVKQKKKKENRLSKMMHFFKNKNVSQS
ncbi:MAG: hypothetical protein M1820_006545 [Bogoriella megaspora]|nr:MAG: hypothetical protein M1820_006545 [Bogoriella megaspora]